MPIPPVSTIPILYYHLNRINPKDEEAEHIAITYDGWRGAIETGNESLAAYYLEENPYLDMLEHRWDNGDSALHVAVKNMKHALTFYLLTQGASVNDQNTYDLSTPLHHAVLNKDEKIVDLLVEWEADPNVTNRAKESPITIASGYKDQDIYLLLADINDIPLDFDQRKTIAHRISRISRISKVHFDMDNLTAIDEQIEHSDNLTSDMDDDEYFQLQRHKVPEPQTATFENAIFERQAELALHATHIAQTNPFSKLERKSRQSARISVIHNLHQKPLPQLQAWLQKKIPNGVVTKYHKRWVIVKGAHILWSAKQRAIKNDADRNERKKFNGNIHLMTIDEINAIDNTSNNRFMVKAKDAKKGTKREYVFKCLNQRERDYWVQGLKEHKRQYQIVLNYLGK